MLLYVECGSSYTDKYKCQISLNYILKIGVVYCIVSKIDLKKKMSVSHPFLILASVGWM